MVIIGWNSWKIISRLLAQPPLSLQTPTSQIYSKGNTPNFNRRGVGIWLWASSLIWCLISSEPPRIIGITLISLQYRVSALHFRYNPPTSHGQTDGRTTYHGNTALRYASRGKNRLVGASARGPAFSWVH